MFGPQGQRGGQFTQQQFGFARQPQGFRGGRGGSARRGAVQRGQPGPYGQFLAGGRLSAQDPAARQEWARQPQSRAARGLPPRIGGRRKLDICDVPVNQCPTGKGKCHVATFQETGNQVCTTNPGAKAARRGEGFQCQGMDEQECGYMASQGICRSVYNPVIGRSYCRTAQNLTQPGQEAAPRGYRSRCTTAASAQECARMPGCHPVEAVTFFNRRLGRDITRGAHCAADRYRALELGEAAPRAAYFGGATRGGKGGSQRTRGRQTAGGGAGGYPGQYFEDY